MHREEGLSGRWTPAECRRVRQLRKRGRGPALQGCSGSGARPLIPRFLPATARASSGSGFPYSAMQPFWSTLADVSAAVRPQKLPKRLQEAVFPGEPLSRQPCRYAFRKDPNRTSTLCGRGGKIGAVRLPPKDRSTLSYGKNIVKPASSDFHKACEILSFARNPQTNCRSRTVFARPGKVAPPPGIPPCARPNFSLTTGHSFDRFLASYSKS